MMNEIKNLKGEVVKTESPENAPWWRLSASTWLLLAGLVLFNVGCFMKPTILDAVLHFFDIRLWPWEILTLLLVAAAVSFQCWRIRRDWSEYYDYEKKHARSFIALSVTILLILCCLFALSLTGRFALFFRPMVNWFVRGHYTLSAVGRSVLVVAALVPLLYFGKEWIFGFWDE